LDEKRGGKREMAQVHDDVSFADLNLIALTQRVMSSYEKKVTDYNFGSLIRTDGRGEYSESNTIFGDDHS